MSDIKVSELNARIVEMVINESIAKLKEDKELDDIKNERLLLYLVTIVLEKSKEALKDNKVSSQERVEIIVEIIIVLVSRLPLSEPLKNVLYNFINDGEIQKIIAELEENTNKKCMRCFLPLFRACMKSKE